jgi:hypothetical protein
MDVIDVYVYWNRSGKPETLHRLPRETIDSDPSKSKRVRGKKQSALIIDTTGVSYPYSLEKLITALETPYFDRNQTNMAMDTARVIRA